MFMLQENKDATGGLLEKTKKTVKKMLKPKENSAKKVVKVVKSKVAQKKLSKTPTKKVVILKKSKPKAYKVSGTFKLDADGNVVKKTKSVNSISVSKKEIVITFNVKRK